MKELIKKVENWAEERGLLVKGNYKNQYIKMISEVGELADAILQADKKKIKDGIGDSLVTLIILTRQLIYTMKHWLLVRK